MPPALSDRLPFLRAIAERPADDAPRLVYADRLDEWGEPHHADLIRVQCALSRMRSAASCRCCGRAGARDANSPDCAACFLESREAVLLGALNKAHFPAVDVAPAWSRGFAESVACPPAAVRALSEGAGSRHPLHTLWLTRWSPAGGWLPASPHATLPFLRLLRVPYPPRGFADSLDEFLAFVKELRALPDVEVSFYQPAGCRSVVDSG